MRDNSQNNLKSWASLKNIDVFIGQKKILSNININLNYGENTVILGPNGSGKSTFLKLLNRSIYPIISRHSSMKLFNKEDINIWDVRMKVGFLFREMEERINTDVKLYDLIASGFSGTFNSSCSIYLSKTERSKVDNLINDWQLNNIIHKNFHSLSDGQKRRSLLARALVYEPSLLVLDEPFCNLDIKSNFILFKNLDTLIKKSVNIIYVTHSLDSILPSTNRVILIKEGKIINDGKPEQIIKSEIISELYEISINIRKQDHYWRCLPG